MDRRSCHEVETTEAGFELGSGFPELDPPATAQARWKLLGVDKSEQSSTNCYLGTDLTGDQRASGLSQESLIGIR